MTTKDSNPKKISTKKTATKKVTAKKATTKKAASVEEETNSAPYLTKPRTEIANDSNSYVMPALLISALTIAIAAMFYGKQFENFVAQLNPVSENQEIAATDETTDSIETITLSETSIVADNPATSNTINSTIELQTNDVSETPKSNVAQIQRSYRNQPAWAVTNTHYANREKQTKAYNEMLNKQKQAYNQAMKQQQEMMLQVQTIRQASYEQIKKQKQEMYLKMKEMHEKSMEIRLEMDKKMKEAFTQYHAI